jgi:AcrR family transcriptional regulator
MGQLSEGRRERRKVVTRQDLVEAGRRHFGTAGLYESKVEDLTRSAGIAKGTFYQYFPSKEALILAVVRQAFERLGVRVDDHCRGARTIGQTAVLMTAAHEAFFRENPDLVRVLHQVRGLIKFRRPGSGPLRAAVGAHLRRIEGRLAATAAGRRLSPRRRRELAEILFGGVSGVFSVRLAMAPRSGGGAAPARFSRSMGALANAYARRDGIA